MTNTKNKILSSSNPKNQNADNVPKLRFPEFKGEWEKKKLGEVATNKSGKYNPEKETESVKCIELEHLASQTSILLGYIDGKNSGSIKNKFDKGDVLFGKLRPYLKKYLLAPFDGVCSSEIWVLKGQNISNEFLFRLVQTDIFIDLANQSSGSKMPRADWDVVKNGVFSFPSLPEQKRIASFFTVLDKKITELKQKKNLLEQYKTGVMQRLFLSDLGLVGLEDDRIDDDDKNENPTIVKSNKSKFRQLRFKDDTSTPLSAGNGKEFPKWEKKKLGEVLDYEQPTNYLVSSTEYDDKFETPVVTAGKTFILGYTDETVGIFTKNLPVIIFDDFTTASQFVNFSFKAKSSAMKILKARENTNIKFIYEAMQMINYEIGGHGRHWISVFAEMEILIPSLAEQTKIANFLSALDEKINQTENQIQQTQQWKKGLLQKMFV